MSYYTSVCSSSFVSIRTPESTSPPSSTRQTSSFNGAVERTPNEGGLLRSEGSYGGVDALRRITRVLRKIVAEWLSEHDAYTLHKPARRHFKRRRVIVGGMRQQWQADLVDLTKLKNDNDGMTFLLTVIDVFSKVAWCVPMKNKSAASLVKALHTTFVNDWPQTLQTDQGVEFLNKSVQALMQSYGIHHFSTHNAETKASIVERFNRTLKTRMWRYFRTWCDRTTTPPTAASAPLRVNAKNQEKVWQRLYGHDGKGVPKLCVSDRVRISKYKGTFEKGYETNWSEERYTRFMPTNHPCTACGTISVKCWTAPSTNWSCRRCRYPSIKCTALNRYCNAVRLVDERRLW